MSANMPSASTRVGLAKFVTVVEIVSALDLCAIATNTGETRRSVNAEVCAGVRDGIAAMERIGEPKQKVSVESIDLARDRRSVDRYNARGCCRG